MYSIIHLHYSFIRQRQESRKEELVRVLLIGNEPHHCPIFRKHLGPDQDPEHGENLQEVILTATKQYSVTKKRKCLDFNMTIKTGSEYTVEHCEFAMLSILCYCEMKQTIKGL